MNLGDVIGAVFILGFIWMVLDVGHTAFTPKHTLMRRERLKNWKRGKTMRPGFRYLDPDGTVCMSLTGREEDCICGKRHRTGPNGENMDHLAEGAK